MTEEEFNNNLIYIRQWRDKKLQESDWTQVADAPVDKEAWATYRQQLRDLPEQYTQESVENGTFALPVEP